VPAIDEVDTLKEEGREGGREEGMNASEGDLSLQLTDPHSTGHAPAIDKGDALKEGGREGGSEGDLAYRQH